ncbi:recombinase family protein [Pseudobutyrivibrio xylanivorans]|uniref:Recombinase family protein n=1 Tax=Pseudobutyrivibrio xylanivorans TaxID=185007 RepID=A0A5P6VQ57_PSEXY|nr:recombinase family protein [Pseudobutyrivibrio xylanivorans]QFJ54806.1 recombinase family protein [Pseudobutyrivibrio xylanivorans]
MVEYGYIRISSKDQNTDRQFDALMKRGISKRNIFVDELSGKNFDRPEYQKMIKKLKKDDLVVAKSIDRLGRNYDEILNQWRIITKEKEANIEILDMPLLNTTTEVNGLTGKFISDLVLQILAYVAETERIFIRQRQSEGIVAARERGVVFGRPKKALSESFQQACNEWNAGAITSREAAEKAGMSHSTFYRRCKETRD